MKAIARRIATATANARSEHRTIARDMAFIAAFILLAKVVAALKEMVVAWRFGTGPVLDAYLFVFGLFMIPVVVSYSVFHAVLIPLVVRLRALDSDADREFRAELTAALLGGGLVLGGLAWLGLRLLLTTVEIGFDPETVAWALVATDYLAVLIPTGLLISLGSVLLMAEGRHSNSLFEGIPSLVLLLVLFAWAAGGLEILAIGTVLGACAQLLVTGWALRRTAPITRLRFAFRSPAWLELRAGVGLMLLAQLMLALTAVVDQFFAASLGTGAVSTLGYATRILALFLALGATTIGRATLPVFSRVRNQDPSALSRMAVQWTLILFAIGLGVVVLALPFAEWIVRLLFERGAFTPADTRLVAGTLRWGLLQVPFYFAMIAASQALFSTGRYGVAAALAAISLASKYLLNLLLVPILGIAGLTASTAGMYAISCIVFVWLLQRTKCKDPET